jgi:type I site-specific restriction endonuclease
MSLPKWMSNNDRRIFDNWKDILENCQHTRVVMIQTITDWLQDKIPDFSTQTNRNEYVDLPQSVLVTFRQHMTQLFAEVQNLQICVENCPLDMSYLVEMADEIYSYFNKVDDHLEDYIITLQDHVSALAKDVSPEFEEITAELSNLMAKLQTAKNKTFDFTIKYTNDDLLSKYMEGLPLALIFTE